MGVLPAVYDPYQSREFKFRITRAGYGEDCSGGPAEVAIQGCFDRSDDYLPSP